MHRVVELARLRRNRHKGPGPCRLYSAVQDADRQTFEGTDRLSDRRNVIVEDELGIAVDVQGRS